MRHRIILAKCLFLMIHHEIFGMRISLSALFLLFFSPLFTIGQNHLSTTPQHQFFSLPLHTPTSAYRPNEVVLKVKPELRAYCTANRIEIAAFRRAKDILHAAPPRKSFPNVQPPTESLNELGEKLVDLSLIYDLNFTAQAPIAEVVNLLLETGIFEYVEPVYLYQTLFDPNDPDTTQQYYLNLLDARQAWDISKGDTSVVIGIVDTGISFLHPDLGSEIQYNMGDTIDGIDNDNDGYIDNYRGWDFGGDGWLSPGDNDPTFGGPGPATDHGVIVSGPAGAATDNGVFIASLGYKCRLLPVKVSINLSPQIYRGYQGVVYAADMGADIINLSWGGTLKSRMGEDAINYAAINKGALVVAAAGNTPADLDFYPASFRHVLSVGGTEQNDAFWNSSTTFGTTYSRLMDLCAPSRDIFTTALNNAFLSATGTSLGSPIVCGVAGLVRSHFPNYTNRQVGERVRVTSETGIYNLNPSSYTEKMGRGRVNAHRALTEVMPSVRTVDIEYVTDDGLIQVGDTVEIRVRFANFLDPVTQLDIDLSTPDWGQIEVVHGDIYAGNLGTLDTVSNWLAPFKIVIRTGTPSGFLGYLRFGYEGTNYSDWEYVTLRVEPSYINMDINRVETSLDGRGRWGYVNFPGLNVGKGLIVDAVGGIMNDAGFLIGRSATEVSNNFENQGGSADQHFSNIDPVRRTFMGSHGDLEAHTVFSDAGAGAAALGVNITQNSYQWDQSPNDNYIIQEFRIANPTSNTLTNIYAGVYFDLDVYWRSNNSSYYDSTSRCIYNFQETWASMWDIGWALLTPDSLHGFAIHPDSFGYSLADKWNALSSPPTLANLPNSNVIQFASAGPFDIAPGDTHIVAFALVVGDSLPDMRANIQDAKDRYWCLIRQNMSLRPDLGPDRTDCAGAASLALDAGPGYSSYAWNTGASSQTISAATSGTYIVTVTDANGCSDYDKIEITLDSGLSAPGFTCSPQSILVGDTISFADTTLGAWEWAWNFGDGTTLCPITPAVSHVYSQPGTYTVEMLVGNGTCFDTVTKILVVDTLVGLANLKLNQLTVYPNPAQTSLAFRLSDASRGHIEVRFSNLHGQRIIQKTVEKKQEKLLGNLSVKELPRGVYFLEISSPAGTLSRKIILQ